MNLELWMMVDEDGNMVTSHDKDKLFELWSDEFGNTGVRTEVVLLEVNYTFPPVRSASVTL